MMHWFFGCVFIQCSYLFLATRLYRGTGGSAASIPGMLSCRKCILLFALTILVFYLFLQASLLSKILVSEPLRTPRSIEGQERRKHQWIRIIQERRQTGWEKNTNGAFIHMGKTAGSSVSLLLRNGCHSFMPKPCRTVPLETIVSRLVGTYYHGMNLCNRSWYVSMSMNFLLTPCFIFVACSP
jgi:hypothetical protein